MHLDMHLDSRTENLDPGHNPVTLIISCPVTSPSNLPHEIYKFGPIFLKIVQLAGCYILSCSAHHGWMVSSCSADTQNQLKMSDSCIMTTGSVVFPKSNTEWTILPARTLSSPCSQFTACLRREKTSRKPNFKTLLEQVHLRKTLQRKMKLSLVLVCHVFQHLF